MRRKTLWIASADVTGVTNLVAGATVLDQTFVADTGEPSLPWTIVRLRGSLYVASDQTATNEDAHGALGAIVVRDAAAAAGVGSIPTPVTEQSDEGWFM